MNPWDAIKDAIIGSVRDGIASFVDANEDVKKFLEERAERMARLVYKYQLSSLQREREVILDSMATVKNTIDLDVGTLAINAAVEGKALFSRILSSVFGTVLKLLPSLI